MQIVIDIDDELVLFDIRNQGLEPKSKTDEIIINALYNGTPLSEVLEDIKAEIRKTLDADWSDGLYRALRIIDKHISGKENGNG